MDMSATEGEAPAATPPPAADGADSAPLPIAPQAAPSAPVAASLEEQLRQLSVAILSDRAPGSLPAPARQAPNELARVAQHLIIGVAAPEAPAVAAAPGPAPAQPLEPVSAAPIAARQDHALGVGRAVAPTTAHGLADAMRGEEATQEAGLRVAAAQGGLPAVLPRLSDYRIAQVEKAGNNFGKEFQAFWLSSAKLTEVHTEMDQAARERGISIPDVINQMKPGGTLAPLQAKFNQAVAETPEAGARRKAMDKALDSYVRQFGRAQEELLNPDQQGNPHYDKLKNRLTAAHDGIGLAASSMPGFVNDKGQLGENHGEKLQRAETAILDKLKDVASDFTTMIRGTPSASVDEPSGPQA